MRGSSIRRYVARRTYIHRLSNTYITLVVSLSNHEQQGLILRRAHDERGLEHRFGPRMNLNQNTSFNPNCRMRGSPDPGSVRVIRPSVDGLFTAVFGMSKFT